MNILIRLTGEMMLKSERVSRRFQKRLLANLKEALKREGIEHQIQGQWSRIWLTSEDKRVLEIVSRVFGVHAYTLVEHECEATLEKILEEGLRIYKPLIQGQTFAVQCSRVGDHTFTSVELNIKLGALLNTGNEKSMVKLKNPDTTVHVDIRHNKAYFYRNTSKAIGGLPIGSAGRCVSLVSGGFDSTVASWMMQKRGLRLNYLFCNLAGEANEHSVLRVLTKLVHTWGYGDFPRLHIVDFQPIVADILKKVRPPFSQVILKRLFYRTAEKLAREVEANGIITGEAISQVSSQTLKNLEAISSSVNMPIHRPLISFDKGDIMDLAKKIGVFEECKQIKEYCQIVPQKPTTACSVDKAKDEESYIDMSLLDKQFTERRILNLLEWDANKILSSYVFKDSIPENAVVLDCQSEELYKKAHHSSATHWDFYDLLAKYNQLPKDKNYLVYCTYGTQSAVIAEKMQKDGFDAFSLRGGLEAFDISCQTKH